jgi:alpha-L-fucosidase
MTPTRRALFRSGAAAGLLGASTALAADLVPPGFDQIAQGPFEPTWDSLNAGYRTPDWFRDAKFGLWAHWGAQCVPEAGDWYARGMYLPGQRAYDHHLKTYGHPADTGFIDIYPQWRAENWNPDDLLDLYAKAGAKYFVAMANHHDNFDAYQSRFHDWNSVRVGPKKDIIGLWAKAARKRGLRFGVSNHSAHAWHWFQTAYGYDPEGPRKGERYDAFKRFAVDGKGKWWEGLDPQQLYGGAVMPLPDGFGTVADTDKWHEANDRVWTEKAPLNNPAFTRQWYLRCKDLIDSYKPDLVYFDNFDLAARTGRPGHRRPLLQCVVAVARQARGGDQHQAARCPPTWHCRRRRARPAQRDQRRALADRHLHRRLALQSADLRGKTLSAGGRGHPSPLRHRLQERQSAAQHTRTRRRDDRLRGAADRRGDRRLDGTVLRGHPRHAPWTIFGEGPTAVAAGMFSEGKQKPFTPQDIRFTRKGDTLYAITLGRPTGGQVVVASLARDLGHAKRPVQRVTLVGDKTPLPFHQDRTSLRVTVPDTALHPFGVALRIEGAL